MSICGLDIVWTVNNSAKLYSFQELPELLTKTCIENLK